MSKHSDDAWIFVSIGDAKGLNGWAPLRDVIGAADSRNHAIPSIAELEGAVSRLVAAGLVESRGTETRLTAAGAKAFKDAERPRAGHIERMFRLGQEWDRADFPPDAPISWSLTESDWEAAYGEYHSWAQRVIARMTRDIPRR